MKYPDRHHSIAMMMRTELRNQNAPFIIHMREQIRQAQGRICPYCSKKLIRLDATIDHVLPKSLGGLDGPGNWLAVHALCNREKAAKMPTGCQLIWVVAINCRLGVEPQIW